MERGLCHCLEIFDKLGSLRRPAGRRMHRQAAHARCPEWDGRRGTQQENLKEDAQQERKIVLREIFNVRRVSPREY